MLAAGCQAKQAHSIVAACHQYKDMLFHLYHLQRCHARKLGLERVDQVILQAEAAVLRQLQQAD